MIPLVPIFLFLMITITLIGVPIARAIARRIDRGSGSNVPPVNPDVTARLDRMEEAIDAIAVEVERIAEGQRFTTKLLAERGGGRLEPETHGASRHG